MTREAQPRTNQYNIIMLSDYTVKRYDALVDELFPDGKKGYYPQPVINTGFMCMLDSWRIHNRPFTLNGVTFTPSHLHEYDCGLIVRKGGKEYWVDYNFVFWLGGIYIDSDRSDI